MADGERTFAYSTYVEDEGGLRGASDGVRTELGELDVHRGRSSGDRLRVRQHGEKGVDLTCDARSQRPDPRQWPCRPAGLTRCRIDGSSARRIRADQPSGQARRDGDQAELVARAFEIDVGRVVRGDGHRPDYVRAAAEHADL